MNYHSILPLVLNLVLRYQDQNGDVQEYDDAINDDDDQSHDHHIPCDQIDDIPIVSPQEEDVKEEQIQWHTW